MVSSYKKTNTPLYAIFLHSGKKIFLILFCVNVHKFKAMEYELAPPSRHILLPEYNEPLFPDFTQPIPKPTPKPRGAAILLKEGRFDNVRVHVIPHSTQYPASPLISSIIIIAAHKGLPTHIISAKKIGWNTLFSCRACTLNTISFEAFATHMQTCHGYNGPFPAP